MDNEEIIRIRKEKLKKIIGIRTSWIYYIALVILVFIGTKIRTLNLHGLKDITTGNWTLGPDLDPFLFLRWAKHIVQNGSLYVIDTFRYVPLGFETKGELLLTSYMIAWFHKFAIIFGSQSVDHSAVIYPVFFFGVTIIAFFLFSREIFLKFEGKNKANVIALIATLFFSIIPALLPRTIAGIPEKESSALFFLFAGLYFFMLAWRYEGRKYSSYALALISGILTACMALIWGGFLYITLTIGMSLFIYFILGKIDKNKIYICLIWLVPALIIMNIFSTRYSISTLLNSTIILIPLSVILFAILHQIIFETKLKKTLRYEDKFNKIPKPIFSLIFGAILGIIFTSLFFGPGFLFSKLTSAIKPLIVPITDRLGVTVAENKQPFFNEWSYSFGPNIFNIPVFLWLFLIGSIYLYHKALKIFSKKEKIYLTLSYTIFILAVVFSRYSPNSMFNGTNFASLMLYFIGAGIFVISFGWYYYKYYKEGKESLFEQLDSFLILFFVFFFLSLISARGAVRLIMMLVPAASLMASYFVFDFSYSAIKTNKDGFKKIIAAILIIGLLFSAYSFYYTSSATARGYVPSIYNYQWQEAMSWVRENTSENAVFAHWWDYGYWIQSIGERATVLDGGNSIAYWNHLMGRYALTGEDNSEALEFLYSHNVTHFLIDSSDIGKYGAFSLIGSDVNLDRQSSISTFIKDPSQVIERKNSTTFLYTGIHVLDEDIIYTDEQEQRIFLPAQNAYIGAVIVEIDNIKDMITEQPLIVVIYNGQQYTVPINYLRYNNVSVDFEEGINSGIFIMPSIAQSGNSVNVDHFGALLFLGDRTVNSQLARLYLYQEKIEGFKLTHNEDDFIVAQVKIAVPQEIGDIIFYQGSLRGPIRIWEVDYPENIQFNKSYIEKDFPDIRLNIA